MSRPWWVSRQPVRFARLPFVYLALTRFFQDLHCPAVHCDYHPRVLVPVQGQCIIRQHDGFPDLHCSRGISANGAEQ